MSRAAAAGRSPREREVRAGPGGGSAGRGRRRRALHSHRELSAAAAGRHTPARRARLSVGAAVCTGFLRRAGPSPCAPLCSKLLWRPERNCRRRALCGGGGGGGASSRWWPQEAGSCPEPPFGALAGRPPARLAGVLGTAVPGGAQRRLAIWIREPGPAGVLELPKAAAQRSGKQRRSGSCFGEEKKKKTSSKKSLALHVFQQVPRGVRPQRQSEMAPPGRWLSRGFLLLARLGRVWVPRSE